MRENEIGRGRTGNVLQDLGTGSGVNRRDRNYYKVVGPNEGRLVVGRKEMKQLGISGFRTERMTESVRPIDRGGVLDGTFTIAADESVNGQTARQCLDANHFPDQGSVEIFAV